MQKKSPIGFADGFSELRLSMATAVKPGGDEVRRQASTSLSETREPASRPYSAI